MRNRVGIAAIVLVSFVGAGCGDDNNTTADKAVQATDDGLASVVDRIAGVSGDYAPIASPSELVARSEFVIEGLVVAMAPGPGLGATDVLPTAVLAVKVDRPTTGRVPKLVDGIAYIETFVREPLTKTLHPTDVRALVYANSQLPPTVPPSEGLQKANPEAGRPKGAPLAWVSHPYGLILGRDDPSTTSGDAVVRPLVSGDEVAARLSEFAPDRPTWPKEVQAEAEGR